MRLTDHPKVGDLWEHSRRCMIKNRILGVITKINDKGTRYWIHWLSSNTVSWYHLSEFNSKAWRKIS